jgi:hypothetical protein
MIWMTGVTADMWWARFYLKLLATTTTTMFMFFWDFESLKKSDRTF